MQPRNAEQLATQMNVEEKNNSHSSEDRYTREVIEESPMYIVGNKEEGYRITMGKYAVSPIIKTIEEAKEYVKQKPWTMILNIIGVTAEGMIEEFSKELENRAMKTWEEISKKID